MMFYICAEEPHLFPISVAAVLTGGHAGRAVQGHGKSSRSPYDGSQPADACRPSSAHPEPWAPFKLLWFLVGVVALLSHLPVD